MHAGARGPGVSDGLKRAGEMASPRGIFFSPLRLLPAPSSPSCTLRPDAGETEPPERESILFERSPKRNATQARGSTAASQIRKRNQIIAVGIEGKIETNQEVAARGNKPGSGGGRGNRAAGREKRRWREGGTRTKGDFLLMMSNHRTLRARALALAKFGRGFLAHFACW